MAKQQEKYDAQILRKNGDSISSIAKKLGVSKSTVSFWCKEISLTPRQITKIAKTSKHHATEALLKAAEKLRDDRKIRVNQANLAGRKIVGKLSNRDVLMVGLGLYWGEGYKKGSQELGFTNSDPSMILFYLKWLKTSFSIDRERLILRVSINYNHINREKVVIKYWSTLLGIPESQFTKTSFIKTKAKKQKYATEHFGTLRVKVRRGTNLRHQILGSIDGLK